MGSTYGDSTQISRPEGSYPSPTLPASTSENAEVGTAAVVAQAVTEVTVSVVPAVQATLAVTAVSEQAEQPDQSAGPGATQADITHRAYRNTRMSVTILRRHQDQEVEYVHSFDITDLTFEKEILSELIAYEEEDDTGVDENDERPPEFQPYDDDLEGPNLHVEEETEVVNIGTVEDVKEVCISTQLLPQARA